MNKRQMDKRELSTAWKNGVRHHFWVLALGLLVWLLAQAEAAVKEWIGAARDYGMWMLGFLTSTTARSRVRRSSPSNPSMGLSDGSSWQTTATRWNVRSKTRRVGMVTTGASSFPLAVSVSRVIVARAGLTPMATAACGGIMVIVAPVSRARRTSRAPLGPLSCAYTTNRPASLRRGYSGTEGDGVALGQGRLGVDSDRQTLGLDEPVVDLVAMGRMGQQAPSERRLGFGIQPVHRNEQPLAMESLSQSIHGFAFHGTRSLA